jgi:hypothetical protein
MDIGIFVLQFTQDSLHLDEGCATFRLFLYWPIFFYEHHIVDRVIVVESAHSVQTINGKITGHNALSSFAKVQRVISLAAIEIDDQKIFGFLKNAFIFVQPRNLRRLALPEVCIYCIPFLAAHGNGVLSIQGFVMVFRVFKTGGVS